MKRRHQRIVELIFSRPTSGNVQWRDVEGLFIELGAEIEERAGSRVSVFLFDEVRVFHRPHPSLNIVPLDITARRPRKNQFNNSLMPSFHLLIVPVSGTERNSDLLMTW